MKQQALAKKRGKATSTVQQRRFLAGVRRGLRKARTIERWKHRDRRRQQAQRERRRCDAHLNSFAEM